LWTRCRHNVGGGEGDESDEGDENDENAKVVDTVLRVGRTA
jgi:hypothetical protein